MEKLIPDDHKNKIKTILQKALRMNLKDSDIKLIRLTGLSNYIYKVSVTSGALPIGDYILRIFGEHMHWLANRERENEIF